jgi:PIN domain nuclease of toxin-antitoxin system
MNLLLDTHAFLWMLAAPERLSAKTRRLLEKADQEIVLSVVVAWEIGIKAARDKLLLPVPLDTLITSCLHRWRMQLLGVELVHVLEAVALPHHHSDPFDRMLVAQARIEQLTLVSADPWVRRYDVPLLRA